MIDDENSPEMQAALQALEGRLDRFRGRELTRNLVDEVFAVTKEHRSWARAALGVDFPVLVALVVPRLGVVEMKRADLELPSIKTSIVNFTRAHPAATMREVVEAFRAAYPWLRPDDVLDRGTKVREGNR